MAPFSIIIVKLCNKYKMGDDMFIKLFSIISVRRHNKMRMRLNARLQMNYRNIAFRKTK